MDGLDSEKCLTGILAEADDNEALQIISESKYYKLTNLNTLSDYMKSEKTLSLFNSNARSLAKHICQFQALFKSIHNAGICFDVITFCETWLDDSLSQTVSFENYVPVYRHKRSVKEGGGLAAFLKEGLEHTIRHDLAFDEEFADKFDGLFIELNELNIIISIIYRSPSFNSIKEFSKSLNEKISKIKRENKKVIIAGDLNIDLLKYSSHHATTEFLDHMLINNIIPKITMPTRTTETSSSLIDHIYTNIDKSRCIAGTLATDISDHYSNFIIAKVSHESNFPKYITYRLMNEHHIENLNNELARYDWKEIYEESDVNKAYELFQKKFSALVDEHLPIKVVKFSKFKHKGQPWITNGILKSLKTKEKLYIKMIKSKGSDGYSRNLDKYKEYNSIYNRCLKNAKAIHWDSIFQQSKNDVKRTWKNINMFLNKRHNNQTLPKSFYQGNNKYTSNADIATGLNEYFTMIGPSLAQNIPLTTETASQLMSKDRVSNSLYLSPATPIEIQNIISKLKPKTSSGHDNISPKLIRKCPHIALPLTFIANLSISTGVFPQNMKIAKVIAIHKKGNLAQIENYRPISLLPTFSKILERLIYNRLFDFLNKHKLLSQSQYGFRKNMSTEYAITELQDRIVKDITNNKWCIGILLDLSKAFDTLDHDILLTKLNHLGIRGITLQWFSSYLSNRKQYTSFKNSTSTLRALACGVPQGSILGPLLFLIYVNDIVDILNQSKAILFADDTNLLCSNIDMKSLIDTINSELCFIKTWFHANKLSLNLDKTSYIVFHSIRKNIPKHNNLVIGTTHIQRESSAKFLGIQIDETLSWKTHIIYKCNQIVKTISVLSRLKHTLPSNILLTIYNALILPHFSYAIVAWGNIRNKEMSRLKILQKKAVRLITKSKYNSHTSPLFRKMNLLKIEDIFTVQCIKLYLKYKLDILPEYHSLQIVTNSDIHSHFTRHNQDLHQQPTKKTLEEQLLNFKIAQEWNKIPNYIKDNLKTISSIGKLKQYLISKYKINCTKRNCDECRN